MSGAERFDLGVVLVALFAVPAIFAVGWWLS